MKYVDENNSVNTKIRDNFPEHLLKFVSSTKIGLAVLLMGLIAESLRTLF